MPDICKCPGEDCPQKLKCVRFNIKPDNDYQVYFSELPINGDESCDYFILDKEVK